MTFTNEDFNKARRISEAIQEYLQQTKITGARTTDLYEMLARKNLIETDRHKGLHFRAFLNRLREEGLLRQLIPQCTWVNSEEGPREWYFYAVSDEQGHQKKVQAPAAIAHEPPVSKEKMQEIVDREMENVEKLPKRTDKDFTPQELEIRQKYRRAYEYWTPDECEILERVFRECENVYSVAELLKRQPHMVKEKLKERWLL